MAELRVPSLQHLSRNWRGESKTIAKALVRLFDDPPIFNYNALHNAARDLLVFKQPYKEVFAGVSKIKREAVRSNLLSVLPLIRDHFADINPDFC